MDINKREGISMKFQELIDKSRLKRKRPCEEFSDDIYQNALDFTFDNIKIDKVLNEVHPSGGQMLSDDLTKMTVESCLSQLESIAYALSSPLNLVTSQVMARALIDLLQQNSDVGRQNCHLLDKMARIKVLSLLDLIKKINASNSFDKVNFVKCLANEDVAVELVWLLNKESLVSVRSYLSSWYEDDNWVEYFSLSIKSLCCDACPVSADLREKIVQGIIGALLEMSYAEASERDLIQQKAKETIFKAVSYVEREIEICSSDESKDWLCVYKVARELTHVSADIIRMFFHDILIEAIGRPCNVTVQEAIACQEKWTSEFLSEATILKYQQFIIVFRNEAVMQIFERAVDSIKSEVVNIEVMAHLLTVFVVYVEEAFKLFDDFLQRCISETVENCDFPQLRLLLLLRRQAALEGSHVSPPYSHWFEKTFVLNGASLGLNSKRTIQFFFKALSDLVPYERPEYLKVHIFKSAQVPVKFKYYVEDYVALAKTRLTDLNESLEESGAGVFRQSHGSVNDEQSKVMEQARVDIEKVLKLYEESGRVPTTIMEASIFRKPYFIGRFLPALLIPRKLPAEADTRARIIDDLNRAGKIPASMLRSYQKKCDQFEESSSSGKPRDNVQYLVDTLEKLPLLVINTIDAAETTKGLSSLLSSISRKMKLIFGDNVHETSSGVLNLDLASLNAKEDQIQASYAIMNTFCRTCAAVQNAKASESAASKRDIVKFRWASKFVSMLVSSPVLMGSLYVHIWSTICYKPHLLEKEHIYGLAILVCHLACSNRGPTCTICLQSSTSMAKSEYYQTFVDLLSNQIMLTSKNSVMFFIRWCCCYLQYAVVAFNTVTINANQVLADGQGGSCYVPEIMVAKMRYLYHKLKFRKIKSNGEAFLDDKNWDILQIVMKSLDTLKITQDQSAVGFSQWLLWELKIEEDFLRENERQQYYNWAIYEHFASCSKQENGDHLDYHEAATQLFLVLMDHYSSEMDNIHSSTEMSLVKILQDIVYLIGSSHRQESKTSGKELESIWLLDCFISRNRKVNSTGNPSRDLEHCCEIISFIRLATLLPPWLLFGNTEWYSSTGQNSKKLTCFLNNHLKPYMFQETFAVPFGFTAHLLKAFFSSTLKQRKENIRHHEEILQQLMREIPLFFGSLVHYWSQLKPVCYRYLVQSELLKQLNSYHLWLNNILDDQFIVPEKIIDEAGLAYAVFLHLKKRLANSSIFVKEIGHISPRMAKLLDNLSSLSASLQGKKVILNLFDNIMAYLVDLIFQGDKIKDEEVWFDISVGILSRCPHVLRVFTQKLEKDSELNAVRTILVAENFSKLLPVIFFRILIRFPKQKMQNTLSLEAFIKTVLIMYTDFSSIYKECAESSLSLSHWKLDLKSFVEVTRLVKDYLMNVSPTLLRSVSEDLIKMLPPEIQALFIRIKRSNCS